METEMQNNVHSAIEKMEGDIGEEILKRSEVEEYKSDKNEDIDNNADVDVRRGKPNKFDDMCDGVLSAMALVHESMQDLLEFKDEMLKHALPQTLLIHLALITGRVFRSISDLGMPVGELVRLVRVYSTPWEEKSIALIKLHESFESKQRQLNIAIKHLQLLDEQSKRMAKEKRVMNWGKLFSKVANGQSHGRQWKFRVDAIKQKAKLGLEYVQNYIQGLDEFSEEEGIHSYEENNEASEEQLSVKVDESENKEMEKGVDSVTGEESKDSEDSQSQEVPVLRAETRLLADVVSQAGSKVVQFNEPVLKSMTSKPSMRDAETWTQDPEFDRFLFIRIFCPEGLDQSELKCSLSYNGKMFKTPILDRPDEETFDFTNERLSERPHTARKVRGRTHPDVTDYKHGSSSTGRKRFCEFEIQLPDEIREGISLLGEKPSSEPEILNFAVHQGRFEEIIAVASIHFKDIKQMNLETVYLPSILGDDAVQATRSRASSVSATSSWNDDSLLDSMDIPIMMDDHTEHLKTSSSHEDLIKNKEPNLFSLYSLHSGKSDSVHTPCGNIPLLMYWGKRIRPLHFNRQCGTCGIFDLVFDMTGIDLATATKEDLQKDMVDEALSVATFTPNAEEDTVPRSEFDQKVEQHQLEINSLHAEYERKVRELTGNLQALQYENPQSVPIIPHQSRPLSITHDLHTSPAAINSAINQSENLDQPLLENHLNFSSPQKSSQLFSQDRKMLDSVKTLSTSFSGKHRPSPPHAQKPSKNFKVGRPLPRWGEHLPEDFFERLHLWEEDSKQHKQELNERTLKDIKDNLEKKLAGQYKLSKHEEQMYDALRDVSLPALFMPFKTGNVYNPRAHQYFQPTGATNIRVTQPPSVFQLPPLPKAKLPVVNLFELSKNFHLQGPAWLLEHYTKHLQTAEEGYLSAEELSSALPQMTTSEQASFAENFNSRKSVSSETEVDS